MGFFHLAMKEETDRAGLRLRPGCEHQTTCTVTFPVDSELCTPVSVEMAYQWKIRSHPAPTPHKRASGLVLGLCCLKEYVNYVCNTTKWSIPFCLLGYDHRSVDKYPLFI